jgi:hypothetical protein
MLKDTLPETLQDKAYPMVTPCVQQAMKEKGNEMTRH